MSFKPGDLVKLKGGFDDTVYKVTWRLGNGSVLEITNAKAEPRGPYLGVLADWLEPAPRPEPEMGAVELDRSYPPDEGYRGVIIMDISVEEARTFIRDLDRDTWRGMPESIFAQYHSLVKAVARYIEEQRS